MKYKYENLLFDEIALYDFLKKFRERLGVTCGRCQSTDHYYINTIRMFTCKKCKHRTSLKSGTVMHASKLHIKVWFQAMLYLSQAKRGVSAKEMQRHLGIRRYRTVFELLHKLRNNMSISEMNRIQGMVKSYVKVQLRMNIRDLNKNNRHEFVMDNSKNIRGKYTISLLSVSDMNKWRPAKRAKVCLARSHNWGESEINQCNHLPRKNFTCWMETHYSNLLKSINAIFHGVSSKYRQLYLDEFNYRTNVSMSGKDSMEELLICSLTSIWNA